VEVSAERGSTTGSRPLAVMRAVFIQLLAIGKVDAIPGTRRIHAGGLVVSPGFIDPHTHSRRSIFDDPFAENYGPGNASAP